MMGSKFKSILMGFAYNSFMNNWLPSSALIFLGQYWIGYY